MLLPRVDWEMGGAAGRFAIYSNRQRNSLVPLRETGVGGARDLYSLSSFPFPFFRMIYFNLGGTLLIFLPLFEPLYLLFH